MSYRLRTRSHYETEQRRHQTYTKVSKDLAAKLQPLILEAVEASGLERNLVQSALLKEPEGTSARIGVATAKRLLKDPAGLVNGYLQAVAVEKARKQGNFDQNLKRMVARVSESFPEDTYQELEGAIPQLPRLPAASGCRGSACPKWGAPPDRRSSGGPGDQ